MGVAFCYLLSSLNGNNAMMMSVEQGANTARGIYFNGDINRYRQISALALVRNIPRAN